MTLMSKAIMAGGLVMSGLSGCAKSSPSETQAAPIVPSVKLPVRATAKPSAGIRVTHELLPDPTDPMRGTVNFEAFESYPSGAVEVSAVADSETLALFGPTVRQSFDMTDTDRHAWSVNYEAETDGRYLISVSVEAQPNGWPAMGHSHAVRIDVGDMSKVAAVPAAKAATDADGQVVILMDAEESIE